MLRPLADFSKQAFARWEALNARAGDDASASHAWDRWADEGQTSPHVIDRARPRAILFVRNDKGRTARAVNGMLVQTGGDAHSGWVGSCGAEHASGR